MATTLQLEVIPTLNPKVMLIRDTSFWDCTNKITNIILEIKSPGRDYYSNMIVQQAFLEVINCSLLDLCCVDCDEDFSDLPDGVYGFKYSFAPNLKTLVEFNHLRTVKLFRKYIAAICELKKNKCGLSRREYQELEANLYKTRLDIEAAKFMVEECGDITQGMDLYSLADKNLDKYTNCLC